jgi:pyruvate dehydrogenase E2 component (dihydrolipoamide acetyltransferase)
MAKSKREIPHYYLAETIPMARALDWLAQENAERPMNERLLPAVLQIKAAAMALRRHPELNGWFSDGAFRPAEGIHPGIAISLRQGGLVAPALMDADRKSLGELMIALADLVKRTRTGSLRSSELTEAGITLTILGDQGVEAVFGVIYPPQVALVGFGRISDRPWVEDGLVRPIPLLTASLSADHRVSDGHRGALFLAELRELLQRPEELAEGA